MATTSELFAILAPDLCDETEGRTNAFLAQLVEYEKAPQVTKTRLYLEAMEEILTKVDGITVIDESIGGLVPLLNLDPADRSADRR